MTLEETRELEIKIANEILNNLPLSAVVDMAQAAAKSKAKEIIDQTPEDKLVEMKEKYAELEAKAKADAEAAAAKGPGNEGEPQNVTNGQT